MVWLKNRQLLKELREMLYKGGQKRLIYLQSDSGRTPPSAQAEDLLVLSLLAQDLANRILTRLTRVLIFLTVVLAFVAGVDIALRIGWIG